ncbi:hypothetical protein Pla52n_66640 [Stieleria varia]|uniref:Uncharacterized protein n=1 Tax=Stieleria varia TaxID=2528005 RepID=A0A5C5ZUM8_9BACT|nr:hypothetical protein Pla52n_66640 [Stieleria varia]
MAQCSGFGENPQLRLQSHQPRASQRFGCPSHTGQSRQPGKPASSTWYHSKERNPQSTSARSAEGSGFKKLRSLRSERTGNRKPRSRRKRKAWDVSPRSRSATIPIEPRRWRQIAGDIVPSLSPLCGFSDAEMWHPKGLTPHTLPYRCSAAICSRRSNRGSCCA